MGKTLRLLGVLLLTGLVACSSQKDPAEKAFAQLRASIDPVSAEMERYAPADYAQLLEVMNDMKAKLNARDYAGVLAMQPKAMAQLLTTSSATAKRRIEVQHELGGEWKQLVAAMPKMLTELKGRVAQLRSGGKLPAGIPEDTVAQVEQQLGILKAEWSAALSSAKNGTMEAAVNKATELKQKCVQLGARVGLKFDDQK